MHWGFWPSLAVLANQLDRKDPFVTVESFPEGGPIVAFACFCVTDGYYFSEWSSFTVQGVVEFLECVTDCWSTPFGFDNNWHPVSLTDDNVGPFIRAYQRACSFRICSPASSGVVEPFRDDGVCVMFRGSLQCSSSWYRSRLM